MLSILHQSGPLGGRWNPCTIGYKTTPRWSEMVQATSRYDPVKLTLRLKKVTHFSHFGPFWTRFWNRYWEIVLSILHQSGSLGGRWNPCTKGYKTTPQSPEMVQATSRYDPVKLTLLLKKLTHFSHFVPFWTRFWNRYWEIVLSMLHQSGPLGGRWNPCTKGYKMTPQSPEMVQATSRYDPGKLTLLLENLTHFWPFWCISDPIFE